ncbi:Spermidine synthase [Yarrowia sp. B02]|nr:Spermidine synthase [Yarrowia sp. B02]
MTVKQLEHASIKDGWFTEISDSFPGQGLMLKVDEVLHVSQSEFQDVLVFRSTEYGNVLVLDGVVQVSERDEFAYQEMICHVAMMSHDCPKRVLVIGGGDGGVLREIVKHESVEAAHLCEIDESVIQLSKKYLPNMAKGFDNPKVTVHIRDGFEFIREAAESDHKYDVIITDSSDPDGPAEKFFQSEYFQLLHSALTDDGIVITQSSENVWLNFKFVKQLRDICKGVFASVEYCAALLPTYTSGQLGLMVCSKKPANLKIPKRAWTREEESKLVRYYNKEMHEASFVLPNWAKHFLEGTSQ